jgi:hypothetical protein
LLNQSTLPGLDKDVLKKFALNSASIPKTCPDKGVGNLSRSCRWKDDEKKG